MPSPCRRPGLRGFLPQGSKAPAGRSAASRLLIALPPGAARLNATPGDKPAATSAPALHQRVGIGLPARQQPAGYADS